MIKIGWGTPAQKYILHDYPNGVAEISEEEVVARITFATKQALKWIETAYQMAEDDEGEHRFAYGIEQARIWQEQAYVLQALLEP